jgi:integrase
MSPVVYNVLQNLYENRDSNCEYVIQLRGKRVLDFKRSFNNALKKANIQDLHWHDLRHTFATWALKGWFSWQTKPFDIYRLQKWLGHKNIKTTQRYAHLETADLHSLINFK